MTVTATQAHIKSHLQARIIAHPRLLRCDLRDALQIQSATQQNQNLKTKTKTQSERSNGT
jgi:hypothetical protein